MHENLVIPLRFEFERFNIRSHFLPNAIGMWPNEQECLLWCCLNSVHGGDWLEIGSFCGGSAVLMCLARQQLNLGPSVLSVDINFNKMFDKNVAAGGFKTLSKKIESNSSDLQLCGQIDFAFIDGFHSFRQVLADFIAIRSNLHEDAIIGFHDVSPNIYKDNNEDYLHECYTYVNTHYNSLANFTEQDFRLDEAVVFICATYGYKIIHIPCRRVEKHFRETQLTDWVRGKTSPFNSFVAIQKDKGNNV